jgi:probable F420-dependent oxidoreductase
MKVDAGLLGSLEQVPERIKALEREGFSGAMTAETSSDPFFPLVLAAEHSERIDLMTSIVVAFARTPMTLALAGHDLNAYSRGRLILGVGSQIRPHITRRFSMPWSKPAARMREFIQAMHAIWDCWYEDRPLEFRGEFYTHTLMTPMFTPGDRSQGRPRVFLAAVGPKMTEVAGEVADGLIAHAFTTERYLREVTLPALGRGLERAGRRRSEFEISYPAFVVTGENEKTTQASLTAVCKQIAFYGSTPAYRPVLELHGWGELQTELNDLSKQGRWDEMGELIDDDILTAFAIVAEPARVAAQLEARYGDLIDRVTWSFSLGDPVRQREAIEQLSGA